MRGRDLVDWMKEWMASHGGMTALEVGQRLGHTGNSTVSNVLRRERKIPRNSIEEWAKALKIRDPEDLAHFRLLAQLDLTPREIREQYWRNVDRVDALEGVVNKLPEGTAALSERIKALEAELVAYRDEARKGVKGGRKGG